MSEAAEKVRNVKQLPVFPLPLVLLPGEILPLHIFEPRYRQMLQDVAEGNNLFGVSLFDSVEAGVDRPGAGTIGCVAEIREIQAMPDGRSNIQTFGLIRYRIAEYVELGNPYLAAELEFFEDYPEDEAELLSLADEIFSLFERVARAAFALSGSRGQFPELQRSDPERFSFVVAAAFNFENEVKYDLLEMRNTTQRFGKLRPVLEAAVEKMENSARVHKAAQSNGHSKTKIDI